MVYLPGGGEKLAGLAMPQGQYDVREPEAGQRQRFPSIPGCVPETGHCTAKPTQHQHLETLRPERPHGPAGTKVDPPGNGTGRNSMAGR